MCAFGTIENRTMVIVRTDCHGKNIGEMMEIENNKEQVPFEYYRNLFQQADTEEITRRLPDVKFDGKSFCVKLFGVTYTVSHPEYGICPEPNLPTQTFLLRYLLESKEAPFGGEFKTFRQMKWGELYIQPYTGRVLTRAAFTFGTRSEAFCTAAEKMGAVKLPRGDAGYLFNVIGSYQMQLLIWEGDEEFPPNAQVLYSDNFEEGFAPEDRVVAGDLLITAIKANM